MAPLYLRLQGDRISRCSLFLFYTRDRKHTHTQSKQPVNKLLIIGTLRVHVTEGPSGARLCPKAHSAVNTVSSKTPVHEVLVIPRLPMRTLRLAGVRNLPRTTQPGGSRAQIRSGQFGSRACAPNQSAFLQDSHVGAPSTLLGSSPVPPYQ